MVHSLCDRDGLVNRTADRPGNEHLAYRCTCAVIDINDTNLVGVVDFAD